MRYLFLLFFLFCMSYSHSQNYVFENYSLEEGLIQAYVLDIMQDSNGYLWLGTQSGVSRFDGHEFTSFTTHSGLGGDHVRKMFQDNDRHFWFGHRYEGFTFYDGNAFISYNICSVVEDFMEDKKGNVFISTLDSGIFVTSKRNYPDSLQFEHITKDDSLSSNAIWDLAIKDEDEIWVITQEGTDKIQYTNNEYNVIKKTLFDSIPDKLMSLLRTDDGTLWGASFNKLWKFLPEENDFQSYELKESFIGDNYIEKIYSFGDSGIWGKSESGAFHFADEQFFYYNEKDGLPDHHVSALIKDHEGTMWFATEGHGVSKLLGEQFKVYNEESGLIDDMVASILEDNQGDVWIATAQGVSRWDGNNYKHYTTKNLLHTNDISVLFQDSKGYIWFGAMNNKGLLRYHPKTKEKRIFNSVDNFPLRALTINEDCHGNIWFGSVWGDLYKYTYTSFKNGYFSDVDDEIFKSKSIWTIHKDKKGNLWFGSDDAGLISYDGQKFSNYGKSKGLKTNRIGAITHDQNNNLWIASNGEGVFCFDGQNFTNYSMEDGLSADNPFIIEIDDKGNVWLGTNTGIDKIDSESKDVMHFGQSEGFVGIESNQNAVLKDKKGNIWFGTINGVVRLTPDKIKEIKIPPKLRLRKIQLFHKDFEYSQYSDSINSFTQLPVNLELPYNQNHLSFHYVGISFLSSQKVRYQYQLKPFDEEWMPLTSAQKATYTNLPPGNYTFKLKSANYRGVWNEEPIRFNFIIRKPFWQKTWFIIIAVIVGFSLIYLAHYLRTWKIKHDKLILERKVNERTAEIEQQKEEIEAQRDEIEAQRNYARKQRDEIANKNIEITSSIQYAKNIQSAVLPPDSYIERVLKNFFILFKPKEIVSGDFYWVLKKGNKTLLAAVDCTGHGIPGAFMSLLGITLLNECIRELDDFNAGDVLNLLRAKVINALHQRGELKKSRDGMDLGMIIFNEDFTKMDYAGAFCPLFIVRDNNIIDYKPDRMPIGIYYKTDQSFTNREINIHTGDKIYLHTDGFVDQMNHKTGKRFLRARFKEILLDISSLPISEQKESLKKVFNEWKGDYEQIDDVLVMGIEI